MTKSKDLINLYFQMLRIRRVEEAIASRYKEQEMRCPTHLYIGQEAVAAGVCHNLKQTDLVVSNHRSHGHYLAKGGDLKKMIAEIYGKVTGCSRGRGGSQHLLDLSVNFCGAIPIVGETIALGTGMAWAEKMKNKKSVTAAFFGDAAVEEGVFAESLNFASLKNLPVLYVCENNLYSILTPMGDRQPEREIYKYAASFAVKSFKGDGNNVTEVDRLSKKAVDFIRQGAGPVFLEFMTYRQREHCGPDFEPVGFRPIEEVEFWMNKDPLKVQERFLSAKKLINDDIKEKMKSEIETEISDAFRFAKESLYPGANFNMEQIFAKS